MAGLASHEQRPRAILVHVGERHRWAAVAIGVGACGSPRGVHNLTAECPKLLYFSQEPPLAGPRLRLVGRGSVS